MTDKLRALRLYQDEFRAAAHQLHNYKIGRLWFEAGVSATDAATWANAGFTPAEALPLIETGITVEMATAGDGEGTSEQRAMDWIDRFREDPHLVVPPDAE